MTIDENPTPVAAEEQEKPAANAEASETTLTDAPSADAPVAEVAPEVAAVSTEPAPAEPVSNEPESTPPAAEENAAPEAPATEAPAAEIPASQPVVSEAPAAEAPAPEVAPEAPVAQTPAVEKPAAPAPTPAPEPVSAADDMALFEQYMNSMDEGEDLADSGYKRLRKGDRIEATVIQVEKDRVFVDLGSKSEGIVPLNELHESADSAHDVVQVGDKIQVVVVKPEAGDQNPIVSKRKADFEETWDKIEEAFRDQRSIQAQVVDRVKGGLVVDIGVRGFVPATHVGSGKLRNIEKYVGQPIDLKVIEIDRERKKVVLSNRQAEEERRVSAKEEIFGNVKVHDVLEGTVRRLTDYGAFIDLGGVDGLLHISEMSWMRINHPKEMFKEGQKIQVMVLRLDKEAGKISLGHRQVLPDPWKLIGETYKINQKLTVTIGRLVQNGAFVKLPEGAEAFLPVSEMSYRRVKRPQDVVEENQEVEVQVIDLNPEGRRMVLSMRAIGGGGELRGPGLGSATSYDDFRDKGRPGGKKGGKKGGRDRGYEDDFEEVGRRGFATGGATIGERLGMLKGFLGRDDDESETEGEAKAETEETTEEA